MLQKDYNGQALASRQALDEANRVTREQSTPVIHLRTTLAFYAAIEFFAVASSAYFASALYHYIGLNSLQAKPTYVLAAAVIATLVLVISIAFRNFTAFRRQARHIFLWRGIGSVALAFSIFITILFFTQSAEAYSRGSLIFQVIAVGLAHRGSRSLYYS